MSAIGCLSPIIRKGAWVTRTPGKIPVKVSYPMSLKHGKQVFATRSQMVLPNRALSGDYQIDFAKLEEDKIDFPTPSNPNRLHEHVGAEEPHPVGLKHKDLETQIEHREEREVYDKNFYKFNQQQDEWEARKKIERRKLEREKGKLEKKKKKTADVRAKIDQLLEEISRLENEIEEARKPEEESWLDKNRILVEPNREILFRGQRLAADAYTYPKSAHRVYIFENLIGEYFLYSKKLGLERFEHSSEAYNRLKEIFTDKTSRNKFLFKQQDFQKQNILEMVENLVNRPYVSEQPMQTTEKTVSEFKSGEDIIRLEGNDGEYKVSTNGVISTVTDNFQQALAKYYSSVSKVIESQSSDRDLALETFGELVLNTSRNARRMMAEMDRMVEVKMLENLDYSKLEFPFNSDFLFGMNVNN